MKITLLACLALALVLVYLSDNTEGYQVYVHWGRRGCPHEGTSNVIYYGYVAKSDWQGKGGGSEFICLPENPQWSTAFKKDMQFVGKGSAGKWWNSRIYSTKFVQYDLHPELGANIDQYHLSDVPCTLCETLKATHHVTMMLPAMHNCPPTWTEHYSGALMSEPSAKQRKSQSNYICVADYQRFVKNGNDKDPHARLAMVEVGCGNNGLIPCSAYPHGQELSCVVCVK